MKNQVDSKIPENPKAIERPLFEKWVSKWAPPYWREQLLKELEEQYKESGSNLQYAAAAARDLGWMIPVMTVDAVNMALLTAGVLMLAVILHSIISGVALLAVAVAMTIFFVRIGHAYPLPSRSEVVVGALAAMSFFVFTLVLALQPAPLDIPASLLLGLSAAGVAGLTLAGMAHYFPKWDPEKYTESECAYRWALALNAGWAFAWYKVQLAGVAAGHSLLDIFFSAAPITLVTAMFYYQTHKDGINIPRKGDSRELTLQWPDSKIFAIQRKRAIVYSFEGVLGEIVVFGLTVAYILTQVYLRPNYDRLRVEYNTLAALMLFAVWPYIRWANRRADALLLAELEMLQEAKRLLQQAKRRAAASDAAQPPESPAER